MDIVGGMLRPASIRRTSFDASSSACPGAISPISWTVNWRSDRCSALGPRPRSSRAILSMRTGPVSDGTVNRPISSMSRRWFSRTANLDRILLRPFLVERDLVVARHRQPEGCCRSSTSARRGRPRACDRRRHALQGSTGSGRSSTSVRLGSFCAATSALFE